MRNVSFPVWESFFSMQFQIQLFLVLLCKPLLSKLFQVFSFLGRRMDIIDQEVKECSAGERGVGVGCMGKRSLGMCSDMRRLFWESDRSKKRITRHPSFVSRVSSSMLFFFHCLSCSVEEEASLNLTSWMVFVLWKQCSLIYLFIVHSFVSSIARLFVFFCVWSVCLLVCLFAYPLFVCVFVLVF